ncbi:restriction endonuclease subunit S [Limosilactobacillus reuteri]|uniref:restriction endonuclease subunit S n=4 Tax=Limosilactobacillus reuteri TaxID=1598 RepID=UPI002B05D7B1|nr:restriction endonuclease subunit S [Limosilactobacillus reuteri]
MKYKLKDIGKITTGKTPSKSIKNAFGGNMNFLTPTDFNGKRYSDSTVRSLSDNGVEAVSNYVVKYPSISVTCIGSDMGKTILNRTNIVSNQQINSISEIIDDINPKYLYYLLTAKRKYLHFLGSGQGSTMPILNKRDFGNIEFFFPEKEQQDSIVKILDVLDKKIELNKAINDNLLELNSTCFKKIFDTSNDYQPADSIADIKIGKTPPRKQSEWFSISSKDLTWVSIKDMKDNTAFISSSNENITLKAVDRFNINVVPKNTVILSFKLTIGRVKISNHELTTNEAIAQFQNSSLPWEFLYTYLKLFPYGTLGSTSSIAKAINSKIIKKMPVLVPNKSLMNQYLKLAIPIFNSLREIQEEQNKLRSVKQELLTKYF